MLNMNFAYDFFPKFGLVNVRGGNSLQKRHHQAIQEYENDLL